MHTDSTAPTLGALGPALLPYLKGAPALYVTGEDTLRLRSFNSAAGVILALEGRVLRLDGSISPISAPHTPNTDRTPATSVHAIGEGWLQHLSLRATAGAPRVGQCFAVVELVRGQTNFIQPLGVVLQGYVKDTSGLAWPGSPIIDSPAGPGVIRSITGTDPAAATEITETVPTNARWRFVGFNAILTTDANVANREVTLVIDDGANVLEEITPANAQTAGTIRRYTFARGVQRGTGAVAGVVNAPLPDVLLMGGFRIRTITSNIQVGDNYGAPQLHVEEWIED